MHYPHNVIEIKAAMVISQLRLALRQQTLNYLREGVDLLYIFNLWKETKSSEVKMVLDQFDPDEEVNKCLDLNVNCISILDPRYPKQLTLIDDAPLILYGLGCLELLQRASVAIVGSRQASDYGLEQASRFSRVLSDSGLVVVSGLALGIDTEAHQAALAGHGGTIAVLGCGIDVIYPPVNKELYHLIQGKGLLISEYPMGSKPRAYHFPRRNRILAGLSQGVMVVEAHERSGSLITAYQALEQGRDVFSLPGPVHHITSRGTHRLIREGAELVESPEEIVVAISEGSLPVVANEEQDPLYRNLSIDLPENSKPDEMKIIDLLRAQSRDYEGLFERLEMAPASFAQAITSLEVEGKIQKNMAGYYEIS